MLFSSMEFLWLFLPVVLIIDRLLPRKAKNFWLLFASLFFYAFGEPVYVLLMLFSIGFNYLAGLAIDPMQGKKRRWALALTISVNIILLGYFKYFDFFVTLSNTILGREVFFLKNIALPIGISFYTFQILSYIIDLYRREIKVQKNPLNLALYISFFPQLIAGPIVNYRDIESDLIDRRAALEKTADGVRRFIYGLSKKVLIANTLALTVDKILALPLGDTPSSYLWFAYLLYSLQIYFDFSGYSDMAIGLGKMFGFRFLENFNYPYLSRSVTEFWRRWHISLSTWFRDYLYIPLGGNRRGIFRTCCNLLIVFLATGLWHGAGLNFLFWGLWHGFFLIIERFLLKEEVDKGGILRRIYTLSVVYFGWILFRAGSITMAGSTLVRMFSFSPGSDAVFFEMFGGIAVVLVAVTAILVSGPLQGLFSGVLERFRGKEWTGYLEIGILALLLFLSILSLVSGSYNPFIYFRF